MDHLTLLKFLLLSLYLGEIWGENLIKSKISSYPIEQVYNGIDSTDDSAKNVNNLNEKHPNEIVSRDQTISNTMNKRAVSVRPTNSASHFSTPIVKKIIVNGTGRTSIGITLRKDDKLLTRALTLEKKSNLTTNTEKKTKVFIPVQNNTQVLAQIGGTATLSCYTGHISDEVVTWLKREDDQLLTIGQELYANEARLSASVSHSTKAWELFVQDVQISDAGQYECQLTTHPPVTFLFTLKVTQAKADIRGPKEVHIEEGSQLDLQCIVKDSPSPPIYIFWIHNGTMVNYESQRGLEVHLENYVSSLIISKVTPSDAGVYTCDPHLAERANVIVHVVTGEKPAAMQHGRNPVNGSGSIISHFGSSYQQSSLACVLLLLLPSVIIQLQTLFLCATLGVPTSFHNSYSID